MGSGVNLDPVVVGGCTAQSLSAVAPSAGRFLGRHSLPAWLTQATTRTCSCVNVTSAEAFVGWKELGGSFAEGTGRADNGASEPAASRMTMACFTPATCRSEAAQCARGCLQLDPIPGYHGPAWMAEGSGHASLSDLARLAARPAEGNLQQQPATPLT